MIRLSKRALAVKPSATLATAAKARELKAAGVDVVGFGTGEPDFVTPEHIREAAKDAINAGFTKYPALTGIPELKAAIIEKFRADNGLEYSPGEVIVNVGAKHTLYNLCQAVLDDGDEALIPAPYWVSYPDMVTLADATPVIVPGDPAKNFVPQADAIAAAITDKTRMIFLNSPSNPTGAVAGEEDLKAIAEVLRQHENVLIMTDDIYEKILYDGRTFVNILNVAPDLKSRTVVVNGVSKAYAMTGWRIGYCGGPAEVIAAMGRIQGQSTSGPTGVAQKAAVAALTGDQGVVEEMRAEFDRRRVHIVERLNAIDGITCAMPGGAFYAFPDIRPLLERSLDGEQLGTDLRFCAELLERHHVAVVPGGPFGADGFLRFSFATSMEEIDKGMDRLAAFVAELD